LSALPYITDDLFYAKIGLIGKGKLSEYGVAHMLKIVSFKHSERGLLKLILACVLAIGAGAGFYLWYQAQQGTVQVSQPEEVRGSAVTLKKLREEYFPQLHEMFSNEVRKGLEFPPVINFGYTIAYMRELERRSSTTKGMLYVIFDNKDNLPIGTIEIREYDPQDVGQMGCWINEKYWGGGRIVEAIKLISKTYFNRYPEEKSFLAWARVWNQRSYKALKKAGFVDDGYIYHNGKPSYYQLKMHKG